MIRNNHLLWLGEAAVRPEIEITINKGTGITQVKPFTCLKFFTPQTTTPETDSHPLSLGSLSRCASLG